MKASFSIMSPPQGWVRRVGISAFIMLAALGLIGLRYGLGALVVAREQGYSTTFGRYLVRMEPLRQGSDEPCRATTFEWSASKQEYQAKSQFHLVNAVSPVNIVLSEDGATLMTLDDWGDRSAANSKTVVLYDVKTGAVIRQYSLKDIIPWEIVDELIHLDSNPVWRHGPPQVSQAPAEVVVRNWPPPPTLEHAKFTRISLRIPFNGDKPILKVDQKR